jgi:hypothetical protein
MDNTHGFERASLLRSVACICAAHWQPEEERMACMTSHVYCLSLLLPWRSSARATTMRVVKQGRTSRTEIAPLGSFCQKAQRAFSVARCRPGFSRVFYATRKRWRRESGGESRTSICQRCRAKTSNSSNMCTPAIMAAIGKTRIEVTRSRFSRV